MITLKFKKAGFSIVEMIVVVAVIGLLAALVYGGVRSARGSARDTARKTDAVAAQHQLEIYFIDNAFYPDAASLETEIPDLFPAPLTDPNGNRVNEAGSDYQYTATGCTLAACTGFYLTFDLEREDDITILSLQ